MKDKDLIQALGLYFGEESLADFLEEMGVAGQPKTEGSDDDAHIISEDMGIDLTFTDESALDVPGIRSYPEGAWVLSGIYFYGDGDESYKKYSGDLPFGLSFNFPLSKVVEVLGGHYQSFMDGEVLRWDKPGYSVFCDIQDGKMVSLSVQLPVSDD